MKSISTYLVNINLNIKFCLIADVCFDYDNNSNIAHCSISAYLQDLLINGSQWSHYNGSVLL